jgi:adenosylhomocysteine nucleosidase
VVGIVAALDAEARTLGPIPRTGRNPHALPDGTLVYVSGIGAAAAEQAARALAAAGAAGLVSWGVAGGLDPALPPGTLLLPREVLDPAAGAAATTAPWRERLARALGRECVTGALLSSAQILSSLEAKARAFRDTGAAGVDMESFAVASVARAHGLPFIVVRAILDAAGDAIPPALLRAAARGASESVARLLPQLLLAPRDWPALARLARRLHRAQGSLRAVARAGVAASFADGAVLQA